MPFGRERMFSSSVYFVETTSNKQRLVLCRLVEFFYEGRRKVQVVVDSSCGARNLDQLLWTFSEESFVPHRVLPSKTVQWTGEPVVITVGNLPVEGFDHLVCDSSVNLEFIKRYRVAVHFVLKDDADRKQESRLLWLACGEQGVGRLHIPHDVADTKWPDFFKLT